MINNGKQSEIAIYQAAPLLADNSAPDTMRISGLAKRFDVCKKTIARHVDHGLLPQPDFHVGRFPHWKVSSIDHWIETRKQV